MKNKKIYITIYLIFVLLITGCSQENSMKTIVTIQGEDFYINGKPTLEGVIWNGINMEGLIPNSRMVQGIFDDLNPETVGRWAYPDTEVWDPERNTEEFVAAMDEWYSHGLLAFTINLQGGSPEGYSKHQPWINNSYTVSGELRPEFMCRLDKILKKSDELGMITILGLFYFGQDENLADEVAVKNAVNNAVSWVLNKGYKNVIIEIANESDNASYQREIIQKPRIPELINLAKSIVKDGKRLQIGTSFNGNQLPSDEVVKVSDFVLIHGNGVKEPERIIEMVDQTRALPSYRPMPIVFNEDDHYDFDKDMNNMIAAFSRHASWGFFDFRRKGESFEEGYQSVPVDWGINSDRKKAFFNILKEITGR
jgi:hypothetical protein